LFINTAGPTQCKLFALGAIAYVTYFQMARDLVKHEICSKQNNTMQTLNEMFWTDENSDILQIWQKSEIQPEFWLKLKPFTASEIKRFNITRYLIKCIIHFAKRHSTIQMQKNSILSAKKVNIAKQLYFTDM